VQAEEMQVVVYGAVRYAVARGKAGAPQRVQRGCVVAVPFRGWWFCRKPAGSIPKVARVVRYRGVMRREAAVRATHRWWEGGAR